MATPKQPASIRIGTITDLERINEIVRAAYSPYIERIGKRPASMRTDFRPLLDAENLFVVEVSGRIVAIVVLSPRGESLEISSLSVLPQYQGRGLGRLLLDFAERRALALGFKALSLYTNARLDELVTYYTRCGFDVVERRATEGFDRVFMNKPVKP